jgi:hypothetical protein
MNNNDYVEIEMTYTEKGDIPPAEIDDCTIILKTGTMKFHPAGDWDTLLQCLPAKAGIPGAMAEDTICITIEEIIANPIAHETDGYPPTILEWLSEDGWVYALEGFEQHFWELWGEFREKKFKAIPRYRTETECFEGYVVNEYLVLDGFDPIKPTTSDDEPTE